MRALFRVVNELVDSFPPNSVHKRHWLYISSTLYRVVIRHPSFLAVVRRRLGRHGIIQTMLTLFEDRANLLQDIWFRTGHRCQTPSLLHWQSTSGWHTTNQAASVWTSKALAARSKFCVEAIRRLASRPSQFFFINGVGTMMTITTSTPILDHASRCKWSVRPSSYIANVRMSAMEIETATGQVLM